MHLGTAATVDVVIVIVYMLVILGIGTYFGKYVKTAKDFFLAGRMLPWWIIGFSIIGTNIGSYDYMGAAGNAYRVGITQATNCVQSRSNLEAYVVFIQVEGV